MRVFGLQPSHVLLIRINLGYGTLLTAACARQGCSASVIYPCLVVHAYGEHDHA
jgi:hypothetical protein